MIPAGMTEDSLTITITNDDENEGNETFKVRLKSLSGAVFASGDTLDAVVTIVDNERPTLTFKGEPFSVAETDTSINIPVQLSGPTGSAVSFTYELIEGSAKPVSDYSIPSNLAGMIPIGMTEDSLTISIPDDDDNEGNETFTVRIKSLSGAVFASGTMLDIVVTITDDEEPELLFKTTEFSPREDIMDAEFEVEVMLTGATDEIVTFDIALGGGTAIKDTDYADPTSLSGMIPIGSTETTITIPITSDMLNEGNETFNLTLSNLMHAVLADDDVTELEQEITIIDDEEPTLKFTKESYSIAEEGTSIDIGVELTGPKATNVSFAYEIIDVTNNISRL